MTYHVLNWKQYYIKNRDRVLVRCNEYRNRPEIKERERIRQKLYYAARSAQIQDKRFTSFLRKRHALFRAIYQCVLKLFFTLNKR